MNNPDPNISTIVATLNSKATLERCLKSIITQNYSPNELIVIDGGSTDGSLSTLKNYTEFISYWKSEPDKGIYHAWNKALKHAKGEWICFIGADDYFWHGDALKDIQPHLISAKKSGIRIVHGQVARVDKNQNVIKIWGKPWDKNRWQMPHGMPLGMPHTGLMHHKSLFEEHGFFDDNFKLAGDYEFILRELKDKNHSAFFIKGMITVGQQVGGTADSNSFRFHQEVAIARRKNGLPKFSWLWWLIHIRTFFRDKLRSARPKALLKPKS